MKNNIYKMLDKQNIDNSDQHLSLTTVKYLEYCTNYKRKRNENAQRLDNRQARSPLHSTMCMAGTQIIDTSPWFLFCQFNWQFFNMSSKSNFLFINYELCRAKVHNDHTTARINLSFVKYILCITVKSLQTHGKNDYIYILAVGH